LRKKVSWNLTGKGPFWHWEVQTLEVLRYHSCNQRDFPYFFLIYQLISVIFFHLFQVDIILELLVCEFLFCCPNLHCLPILHTQPSLQDLFFVHEPYLFLCSSVNTIHSGPSKKPLDIFESL
jgi:hypothetical protein